MRALDDGEMERLFGLLAKGELSNAEEIAGLLKIELGETPPSAPLAPDLQGQLEMLCRIANHV